MTKVKGQYFTIGSFIVVFLMYMFSTAILKQEVIKNEEIVELEKAEEILFYVNKTLSNLDLYSNDSYQYLVNIKNVLQEQNKHLGMRELTLDYVYDNNLNKWNVTLEIRSNFVYILKRW